MSDLTQYPFEIRPLSKEDGGGYLISFSDFSECISDGETAEEAIRNGFTNNTNFENRFHS